MLTVPGKIHVVSTVHLVAFPPPTLLPPPPFFFRFYLLNLLGFSGSLVKNLPVMQETPVPFLDQEDPLEKGYANPLQYSWVSLVSQLVKNLPVMLETWV